jgi:AcrR family transcriptional regulator
MARKSLTQIEIERFRTAYCEKAYELYKQDDYHAISMRGIAKAIGCSSMMAYRYFEDKEDVFASLRAILFHRLANSLEAVPDSLSPLNYLKKLGMAYAGFAHEEPHAYRLLYMIHIQKAKIYPEVEQAQLRTQKVLVNATLRAKESGCIQGDPVVLVHTLWALIHGLVSLNLAGQLNQGANFDELFPSMLDPLLKKY